MVGEVGKSVGAAGSAEERKEERMEDLLYEEFMLYYSAGYVYSENTQNRERKKKQKF